MTGTHDVHDALSSAEAVFRHAATPEAPPAIRGVTACRAAFMAESLGKEGQAAVPRRCKQLGVLLLRRSHGSIVKAQAHTLRFLA